MNLFDRAGKLAGTAAAAVKQQANQTLTKGAEDLATTVSASKQAGDHAHQQLIAAGQAISNCQNEIAAFSTSGMVAADALKDLPRTAQAIAEEMPKLARRLQTAGTRLGDVPRADADIVGLFNKIPGTSKLGASEWDIRAFLSDKHGSHIYPHSKGGSNSAKNIVWEVGADNIRRGARGNKITEEKQQQLEIDIRQLVDGQSQADPQLRTTFYYARVSAQAVRDALIEEKGYTDESLHSRHPIGTMLNRMGYRPKNAESKAA